MIVGNYAYSG